MKKSLIVVCAAVCFSAGAVVAENQVDESNLIELSAEQMDQVTAGSLILPNGKVVFAGFALPNVDDPYGVDFLSHPGLFSNPAAGPWQAHFNSPVIEEGF